MLGMDCINQQTAQDRDCSHCIWHTDGRCASWDCEYVSRKEALEAVEKVKNMTPMVLPPEQPEIIHCKECQYGVQDDDERWYCRSFGCQVGEGDGSGFCADAERRTDEQT